MVIVALVAAVWLTLPSWQPVRWTPTLEDVPLIGSGGFAIALIYVNYAYTGWNAATYIGGEFDNPGRVLPRALITATASVMLLYLLLHVMFLSAAPMEAMAVVIEIGYVVAEYTFGVSAA